MSTKNNDILRYSIFSLLIIAFVYLGELGYFLTPLFNMIYHGNLNVLFYNITRAFVNIFAAIGLNVYAFKHFENEIEKKPISLKRIFIVYLISASIVLLVTMSLGFTIKITYELGENLTAMNVVNNIGNICEAAIKIIMKIMLIKYVELICDKTIRMKYNKLTYVPFGGIAVMLAFGIFELITHGLTFLNILFLFINVIYGLIYLLLNRNAIKSTLVCVVIQLF